ncbi:MAG TPA: DUF4331 family protein [Bryobacteraceae bacterium]|nr:DUF4331 family protein [Bryobacteraceae bacterium]
MSHSMNFTRVLKGILLLCAAALIGTLIFRPTGHIMAADHRDAPTVDGLPEGDITDVFTFLDPNDPTRVFLAMNVNPFAIPASSSTYRYSPDFLYEFKIDNTGDAVEDVVIQVMFAGTGVPQTVNVFGPTAPSSTGIQASKPMGTPTVTGLTGQTLTDSSGQIQLFAGQRDDPFVFDFSQFTNILNNNQDLFRAVGTSFRGRPTQTGANGLFSGVDSFAGFNLSTIAVEVPKSMLGPGFTCITGSGHCINVWATVSRPQVQVQGGSNSTLMVQFERMGQEGFNTVFGTTPAVKDQINATAPADDMKNWSSLVPDALTTTDNDGTGNTIANRAALLTNLGLTATPNGAALIIPANFNNTTKDLLRIALLPDVLRLNLDALPPNDLLIGQFGLQNGRRLGDDVIDIALQLLRSLTDVQFPPNSQIPGSGPLGSRAALNCTNYPSCQDRRVLVVLQGTDFIKPDSELANLAISANDATFNTTFPFLASPHAMP